MDKTPIWILWLTCSPASIEDGENRPLIKEGLVESRASQKMKLSQYGVSLAAACFILFAVNWLDYERYRRLIPGYDYIIGFGLPFEFFFKGGSLDLESGILWRALAGNIFAVLILAASIAWIWQQIVRKG